MVDIAHTKSIIFFGQEAKVACDGKCEKAWGINTRPRHYFVDAEKDPDDYEFLSDAELARAPKDPGTYEGGVAKPRTPDQVMNKWCVRECERCWMSEPGKPKDTPVLPDYSKRRANKPERQT